MSDKVIHYCRHCGDTWGGDNPCDCPAASIDAVLAGRAGEIAALTERLRIVEAERDEARNGVKKSAEAYGALMEHAEKLRAELERKDAALKIYQARAHRNANSTCDGCPFAVAERDVNWADRAEGYYTCGLDSKERWGEDPACPDALYKEPPCKA